MQDLNRSNTCWPNIHLPDRKCDVRIDCQIPTGPSPNFLYAPAMVQTESSSLHMHDKLTQYLNYISLVRQELNPEFIAFTVEMRGR